MHGGNYPNGPFDPLLPTPVDGGEEHVLPENLIHMMSEEGQMESVAAPSLIISENLQPIITQGKTKKI